MNLDRKNEASRKRLANFTGRLGIQDNSAQKEGLANLLPTKQRGKGEPTINYSSYKDRACRRGVQALMEASTNCQQMFRFGDEAKNQNPLNSRMRVVVFVIDPLCPKTIDGCRTEPLRIAIGDKEDIECVVNEIKDNSQKFLASQDEVHVDELIYGRDVVSLETMMQRKKSKNKDAEDVEENKKSLSKIEFAKKTPLKGRNANVEKDDEEVSFGG